MTALYFAYGSNMNPARMAARGMRYVDSASATLGGWRLRFNKRAEGKRGIAYANVVPDPDNRVEGVLYRLTETEEIARMDPYEGYPVRYIRRVMDVEAQGSLLPAWVYIANPDWQEEGLVPERFYLNHLLSGRPWLSEDYFRDLARTVCC